jgi:hypothetical protein
LVDPGGRPEPGLPGFGAPAGQPRERPGAVTAGEHTVEGDVAAGLIGAASPVPVTIRSAYPRRRRGHASSP